MKLGCKLKLGDRVEWLIDKITFGNGHYWAYKIAIKLGYKSCGCEERRIAMNEWTCNPHKELQILLNKKEKLDNKIHKLITEIENQTWEKLV